MAVKLQLMDIWITTPICAVHISEEAAASVSEVEVPLKWYHNQKFTIRNTSLALRADPAVNSVIWYWNDNVTERSLEDHEEVLAVYHDMETNGKHTEKRFIFRKDFCKYEFFHSPQVC
jgi:hypothetical protein